MDRKGGNKSWRPLAFPAIIGWDVSGTVEAAGSGVTNFVPGDRVCGWAFATYAERCVMKAEYLASLRDDIDIVDAGALPLVATTGYQLVSVASGLRKGQTVLVSGALGGVGRSAVFAAKERDAIVTAGVTRRQLNEASSLGVDHVVALDDQVGFLALEQFDVIANCVGGDTRSQLMTKVKSGGTFASVTGVPESAKDFPDVRAVAFVSHQDAQLLEHIIDAVREGCFTIPIDRRIPLAQAAEAHKAMESGTAGKIVLVA